MTGIVTPYGYNGISGSLQSALTSLAQAEKEQETATASGVKAETYADLGSSRTQALSLQPAITQIAAWNGNVKAAQNTLTVTQSTMGLISDIAKNLNQTLSTLQDNAMPANVSTAVAQAKTALDSLGSLLNTQNGNEYIFSGQNADMPPVSDSGSMSSTTLAADIQNIVSTIDQPDGADVQSVLQNTLSISADTTAGNPFSANLSTDPVTVSGQASKAVVGSNYSMTVGVVATQGGPASKISTGSPIRDLMRNLMVVASLGNVKASTSSFNQLVQGIQQTNTSVVAGLADMTGVMGVTQNNLTSQANALNQANSMLVAQLGQTKNVDFAELSAQLTMTKNQLQASYSIIADMKGMTLASYI